MKRALHVIAYSFWLVGQVIVAATEVIIDNYRPRPHQQPVLLSVPLRITNDVDVVLLAGSITVTPGTLVCGIRRLPGEKRLLLVHCIFGSDLAALRSDFYTTEQRLVPAVADEPWPEVSVVPDYDPDKYPDPDATTGTRFEQTADEAAGSRKDGEG